MSEVVDNLVELKGILRENEIPFFSDIELEQQLSLAQNDVNMAAYRCCIIKAENCGLAVSGLTLADTSKYWLRIAALYRPSCTCTI